jgi:hypothetical protein
VVPYPRYIWWFCPCHKTCGHVRGAACDW